MKTQYEDGLWIRNTYFKHHKIKVVIYRTPYSWRADASYNGGSIGCTGDSPLTVAKYAIKNLRSNILIWSKGPHFA